MSPAEEIAQHLADNGIGARAGDGVWGIHVSQEPDSPDDVVTVYDTGGLDPIQVDIDLRQPTIQIRVRGSLHSDVRSTHDSIYSILDAVQGAEIESHHYIGIWIQGDIIDIGRDDNDRFRATANYRINRQPAEGTT